MNPIIVMQLQELTRTGSPAMQSCGPSCWQDSRASLTFICPSVKLRYPAGEFQYCHAAISDPMRHHDIVSL
jgi:hypothetical protein